METHVKVEKIMVWDWGGSEMLVNSCLEDLEGRMRLKRMRKFVLQLGKKKEKQMSVGEH